MIYLRDARNIPERRCGVQIGGDLQKASSRLIYKGRGSVRYDIRLMGGMDQMEALLKGFESKWFPWNILTAPCRHLISLYNQNDSHCNPQYLEILLWIHLIASPYDFANSH